MSNIVIPDGGNIGSASDPDALTISASGLLTMASGNGRRLLNITTITAIGLGTHTLNSNTTHIICWVQGAGGGGGGGDAYNRNGTGGGGGGFCIASLDVVYATSSTLSLGVGAKGTAGPASSGAGGNGGNSVVTWNTSNTITCTGGDGGIRGGGSPATGGEGRGASVSGFTSILSQLGGRGRSTKNGSYLYGGSDGGDSFLGFGGPGASSNHDAQAGKAFGSGGGGGCGTGSSGAREGATGADGIIIIYEYI